MCAVLERGQINDEGVDFLWLSQGFRGYYGELRGSTMFFYADEKHETVNASCANHTQNTHAHTHYTHSHTHTTHTHTHTRHTLHTLTHCTHTTNRHTHPHNTHTHTHTHNTTPPSSTL